MKAGNYVAMCEAFQKNVPFRENSPVGSPSGSPFDAAKLAQVIAENAGLLPAIYRSSYVAPLIEALPSVIAQLKQQEAQAVRQGSSQADARADVQSLMDTLVGAVRDPGEPDYHAPLARFEAVISNLYRSFLGKEQRAQVGLPLLETVPPLATFAPTPEQGPFTLPIDGVKQLTGASVGVVSLPGSYARHPLLWPALAHETGGHDVLHADPGLLDELASQASNLDGLLPGLGSVWASWIDETASDVYGLLNVGPSFAISLAAFFSALENSGDPLKRLGTIGAQLPVLDGQLVDPHPVDLLRLHVATGVVEALDGLSVTTRSTWLTLIGSVADTAAGGAKTIDVVDVRARAIVQKLPLDAMADAARKVGALIASQRLEALGGHSIQDIETWDDADEKAAVDIAALAATKSIVGLGDDAQLLAGATVALLDDPSKYAAITTRLEAALDDSFARDPIFGTPLARSALALQRRSRARSRTPVSPKFPIPLLA
jgi:hypothetical protein